MAFCIFDDSHDFQGFARYAVRFTVHSKQGAPAMDGAGDQVMQDFAHISRRGPI
jgi:hypothetical protein